MKISNEKFDSHLNGSVRNNCFNERLSPEKPSIRKKHVKKQKAVSGALKELDIKHNWSWYEEILDRYKNNLIKEAIFYRGNSISAKKMFEKADLLADAFDKIGVKKGEEILICMSNVPEAIYVLLAASKCGAVVNSIGADFDSEYIKQIVSRKRRKLFIGTDDKYYKILSIISDADFEYKVLVSLSDSLPNGKDPYGQLDEKFYKFENKIPEYRKADTSIQTFEEFLKLGECHVSYFSEISIDDEFTVTYTSGSTKIGFPKAIVHKNRAYISIARFHDPDLSRMPAMRNMRGLAHIPLHSNTNIASGISDTLSQICSVACEPIYNSEFFLNSLIINEPGFVPATRSFWIAACMQYKKTPKIYRGKLNKLVNAVSVGENISKNEEKFINSFFRQIKAGCGILPPILSPITLSIGGGNCEHGGLFFTLFHGLREKFSLSNESRRDYGLTPFQLVDMAVLREDGSECNYNEYGRLVANSPCTMKEYRDNEEENLKFYLKDAYGRIWADCCVWACIGRNGNVHMKSRKGAEIILSNNRIIPLFLIEDTILEDRKNILSCEVVNTELNGTKVVAAHIQLYPEHAMCDWHEVLKGIQQRCIERFPEELLDKLYFKKRDEEMYPLTKSGKRNVRILELEGIDRKCIKCI